MDAIFACHVVFMYRINSRGVELQSCNIYVLKFQFCH